MGQDWTCIFHGRKMSEHDCLVCCLCFCNLTIEKCHVLPNGQREDVCKDCAAEEAILMKIKNNEQ